MCTALYYQNKLFGRTFDEEHHYQQQIITIKEDEPLFFRYLGKIEKHYAMIGIGIKKEIPLYFDAMNEHGLAIAALNFPSEATYENKKGNDLCVFEFIPYLLATCKNVAEVIFTMKHHHLCNESYSKEYEVTPLHWMVVDHQRCIVIEPLKDGLHIMENEYGVLSNAPNFLQQVQHYQQCNIIPSDESSTSRFIRLIDRKQKIKPYQNDFITFYHLINQVLVLKGYPQSSQYITCYDIKKLCFYYHDVESLQTTSQSLKKIHNLLKI